MTSMLDLPTEAQWEYACGACVNWDTGRIYDYAIFAENRIAADTYRWWFAKRFGPDDIERKPNPIGLYDMLGLVDEWCYDIVPAVNETTKCCPFYQSCRNGVLDPLGPDLHSFSKRDFVERAVRGGNIFSSDTASHDRGSEHASGRYRFVGFRVVRNV